MPSLPDTAVIILLGLLLFGPKGLAQIARQVGKLMGEFRRASNEFRMQMEEELRISEQTDRQKQIAAVEAAAPPVPTAIDPVLASPRAEEIGVGDTMEGQPHTPAMDSLPVSEPGIVADPKAAAEPIPIATSGEMSIMPPASGLPVPRSASSVSSSLSSLIGAVPKVDGPGATASGNGGTQHPEEEERPMRYTNQSSELPQDVAAEESLHG